MAPPLHAQLRREAQPLPPVHQAALSCRQLLSHMFTMDSPLLQMSLHLYFARAHAPQVLQAQFVPMTVTEAHSLFPHHTISTVELASSKYTLTHVTAAVVFTVTFTLPNRSIRTAASPHGRTGLPRQGARRGRETKTREGKARGGAEKTREGRGRRGEGRRRRGKGGGGEGGEGREGKGPGGSPARRHTTRQHALLLTDSHRTCSLTQVPHVAEVYRLSRVEGVLLSFTTQHHQLLDSSRRSRSRSWSFDARLIC